MLSTIAPASLVDHARTAFVLFVAYTFARALWALLVPGAAVPTARIFLPPQPVVAAAGQPTSASRAWLRCELTDPCRSSDWLAVCRDACGDDAAQELAQGVDCNRSSCVSHRQTRPSTALPASPIRAGNASPQSQPASRSSTPISLLRSAPSAAVRNDGGALEAFKMRHSPASGALTVASLRADIAQARRCDGALGRAIPGACRMHDDVHTRHVTTWQAARVSSVGPHRSAPAADQGRTRCARSDRDGSPHVAQSRACAPGIRYARLGPDPAAPTRPTPLHPPSPRRSRRALR